MKPEKAMAPHSNTLALKTPWMEEPGRLHPWGHEESDMTERLHFHFSLSCIGEVNGNLLQCSCLENPRNRGAWWAAVSGVTQSQTLLKRLSSSSSEWNKKKKKRRLTDTDNKLVVTSGEEEKQHGGKERETERERRFLWYYMKSCEWNFKKLWKIIEFKKNLSFNKYSLSVYQEKHLKPKATTNR